ncbi:MAG: hypothetical protein ABIG89_04860 [Candidatus Woesearchaeota archaeon]
MIKKRVKNSHKITFIILFVISLIILFLLILHLHYISLHNSKETITGKASATGVGFSIQNVAPVIGAVESYMYYKNSTFYSEGSVYTVCNTSAGTSIYMTGNYTDKNHYKDVSQLGNYSFRIQAILSDGSVDSSGFDTGYFNATFESGSSLSGLFYDSYTLYYQNLTKSPQNFSINARVHDSAVSVDSITTQNAVIKIYIVPCEETASTPAASPASGGGGGGGTNYIYLPSEKGSEAADKGVSIPSYPSQKVPAKETNTPVVPAKPGMLDGKSPEIVNIEKIKQLKEQTEKYTEKISKIIPIKSLTAIVEESDDAVLQIEKELGVKLDDIVKSELKVALLEKVSDKLSPELSDVDKEEKIDEILDDIESKAKVSAGASPESNFVGKAIKVLSKVKKYEQTKEKEVSLSVKEKIKFKVNDQRHSATIQEIKDDTVFFILRSNPLNVSMSIGETKDFDIDNDTIKDIRVTVLEINGKDKVKIFIQSLDKEMIIESKKTTFNMVEQVSDINDFEWFMIFAAILIIIIILQHVFLLFSTRKLKTINKNYGRLYTYYNNLERFILSTFAHNIPQELIKYIHKHLLKNIPEHLIVNELVKAGWAKHMVYRALEYVKRYNSKHK